MTQPTDDGWPKQPPALPRPRAAGLAAERRRGDGVARERPGSAAAKARNAPTPGPPAPGEWVVVLGKDGKPHAVWRQDPFGRRP